MVTTTTTMMIRRKTAMTTITIVITISQTTNIIQYNQVRWGYVHAVKLVSVKMLLHLLSTEISWSDGPTRRPLVETRALYRSCSHNPSSTSLLSSWSSITCFLLFSSYSNMRFAKTPLRDCVQFITDTFSNHVSSQCKCIVFVLSPVSWKSL